MSPVYGAAVENSDATGCSPLVLIAPEPELNVFRVWHHLTYPEGMLISVEINDI